MKKNLILAGAFLAFVLTACAPPATRLSLPNPGYQVEDNVNRPPNPIRFGNSVSYRIALTARFSILSNRAGEDLIATLPLPPDTPSQRVASWDVSPRPFREATSRYGYRFLEFNLGRSGDHTLEYTAEVDLQGVKYRIDPAAAGAPGDIPEGIARDYTVDGPYYNIRSPAIVEALARAAGDERDPYQAVRRIWNFTRRTLFYKMGWKVAADATLKRGYGSCTDYSFVMIALCRAAGIPARYTSGTFSPPPHKTRGEDRYFHKIVEVYYPKIGWAPIESTRGTRLPEPEQGQKYFDARDNKLFSFIYEPEPGLVRTDPRKNTVSYHSSGPGRMVVKMTVVGSWIRENL